MTVFSDNLLSEILKNKNNQLIDNFDPMMKYDPRYREINIGGSLINRIINSRIPIGCEMNTTRHLLNAVNPKKFYKSLIKSYEAMSFLYNHLQDKTSQDLLIKLLAYRILGHTKVKLPRNQPKYWHDIDRIAQYEIEEGSMQISFLNLNLPLLDLSPLNFNIKANVTPAGAAAIFAQKQYEYETSDVSIKASLGDTVLDCGACWGETSLYFSHEVGRKGKVYSFEFIPENVNIFNKNINHNPTLKDNIHLVKNPVWNISNENLFYSDHGPGSSISQIEKQSNTQVCKTVAIDDFVNANQVDKVNFIKMDIEGAEMNALFGAEQTLKTFRPKLAISAYHKSDDLITIPQYLNNLNLGYRFYLDHHTIHFWETVLYAYADN